MKLGFAREPWIGQDQADGVHLRVLHSSILHQRHHAQSHRHVCCLGLCEKLAWGLPRSIAASVDDDSVVDLPDWLESKKERGERVGKTSSAQSVGSVGSGFSDVSPS